MKLDTLFGKFKPDLLPVCADCRSITGRTCQARSPDVGGNHLLCENLRLNDFSRSFVVQTAEVIWAKVLIFLPRKYQRYY